jgi:hypothetical protein
VKRPGGDEPIWVVIYMEAMLGISLYNILISTSKTTLSFLLLLMSPLQQNWRRRQNRFCLEVRRVGGEGRGRGAGGRDCPMYAQMNKCEYERWPKQYMHI